MASFDPERGLGIVRSRGIAKPGGMLEHPGDFPFHCTDITDGTRRIEPGTDVAFVVAPSVGGAFEARSVTRIVRATGG